MRNFLPYPFGAYSGIISSKPFTYQNIKGTLVAADIAWAGYRVGGAQLGTANPNFAVQIDMSAVGPNIAPQEWTISAIYIDNLGNNFPVYAFFPDTRFTVSCPPLAAGWFPCFTNARKAWIIGTGLTDADTLLLPHTQVIFSNIIFPPYTDEEFPQSASLYKASASISRGLGILNQNYGIPALGDQVFFLPLSLITANTQVILNSPVASGGFYYITGIDLTMISADSTGAAITSIRIFGSVTGTIFSWDWASRTVPFTLFNMSGMNIKLPANETYSISNSVPFGGSLASANLTMVYTTNPT